MVFEVCCFVGFVFVVIVDVIVVELLFYLFVVVDVVVEENFVFCFFECMMLCMVGFEKLFCRVFEEDFLEFFVVY